MHVYDRYRRRTMRAIQVQVLMCPSLTLVVVVATNLIT